MWVQFKSKRQRLQLGRPHVFIGVNIKRQKLIFLQQNSIPIEFIAYQHCHLVEPRFRMSKVDLSSFRI